VGTDWSKAATLPTGFTEAAFGNSLATGCTAMEFAPDGRLFVCTQNGHLRVIKNGVLLANDFVTLTVDSRTERGLLGIAFDPNFSSNRFVYLYYTVPTGSIHNRVSRFTASLGNPDVSDGTEVPILDLDNLSAAQNHNGGAIHFGPDGKLYVGVGENANGPNSQSLTTRLGKILRINSDGSVITGPGANPITFPGIAGSPSGVNLAIWSVGLRNPFTFAFQPGTTRMFINDVGQSTWEEINDGIAGRNYGWPTSEGPDNLGANFTGPLYYYNHTTGTPTGCAIVGGAFYNPSVLQFPTSYVGKYFFGDLCGGFIYLMNPSNNTASAFATAISGMLVDLKVGPDGALYYLVQSGQVTRVQATPSQALNISTRARIETGEDVLIGGFIITGSGAKNVIIRGLGPSLPPSVPTRMVDPVLELHGPQPSGALIASNNDWRVPVQNQTAVQATGLQPGDDHEPAIVASLQPGGYTAIMSGSGGTSGSGLVEVYDLNTGATSQLGNISGRSFVQTGDNVMIGGFIIGNNIGASKVIVRALGPSLATAGVANPLADPTVELHDGNGAFIRFNNDWQDDATQAAQITAAGLQPTNSLESAIFVALAPGAYTAIVRGNGGGTGVGLVEVYKVP
jgi:glucose/arabinose dehydrogenase